MANNQSKFFRVNVPERLGFSRISTISDREVWTHIVTPMVGAFLGEIVSSYSVDKETVQGEFPFDEVDNLNDHRLYGGQLGFVRNWYIENVYKTRNGALVIKRDGVKLEVLAFFGDYEHGKGEFIFKVALRDRRFDGTRRANDTALLSYEYDDPALNTPLEVNGRRLRSVELSIYGFMPGARIVDATGDQDLDDFVRNPYTFLDRPVLFLELFNKAWNSKRSPGQVATPIPDVAKRVIGGLEYLAKKKGYEVIQNAPSHFHVLMWGLSTGYTITDPAMAQIVSDFKAGIKRIKESGVQLTRPQESWVCALQSLPEDLIPPELRMRGPQWPQNNIDQKNLWIHKALTDEAKAFLGT
jgi:hypothetical protein